MATALAVLRLAADGALALDDPLAHHLPDAAAARKNVTLRALLCHIGGLPGDVTPELAPYALGLDWPTLTLLVSQLHRSCRLGRACTIATLAPAGWRPSSSG